MKYFLRILETGLDEQDMETLFFFVMHTGFRSMQANLREDSILLEIDAQEIPGDMSRLKQFAEELSERIQKKLFIEYGRKGIVG